MKRIFTCLVLTGLLAMMGFKAWSSTTIYFDNSATQWPQVNIHYWNTPNTSWPGVTCQKVEADVWSYTFTGDASKLAGFLFCNGDGSQQTADMPGVPADGHIYRTGAKDSKGHYLISDGGTWAVDPEKPQITASPASGTKFEESLTVTLSVTPDATLYYTTDGTAASTSSAVYSSPLTLTESTTLNVLAETAGGKTAQETFQYTRRQVITVEGKNLITDYYKVNPDGKCGTRRTVPMTFSDQKSTTAMSNWSDNDLIAQGVARDVCMAFRGVHERPVVDSYSIYASYDNDNLYLAAQLVYTVWDAYGEGKQPGESKPYNMDGALIWAFDLDPMEQFDGRINGNGPIWHDRDKGFNFQNGVDALWIGSTKPGVGVPGYFIPTADGHASYDATYCKSIPGKYYGYADGLLPDIEHIWGQKEFRYDPEDLKTNAGFVDLKGEIATSAHTVYEWRFPLSLLGVTADYIEQRGIGVMFVDQYGESPVGGTPYDPSYFDNVDTPYSKDESTSAEKEDDDFITYAPARVGKLVQNQGVSDIETDIQAPAEYYNLQGVRIAGTLAPGLYIKRQGTHTSKVLVR